MFPALLAFRYGQKRAVQRTKPDSEMDEDGRRNSGQRIPEVDKNGTGYGQRRMQRGTDPESVFVHR